MSLNLGALKPEQGLDSSRGVNVGSDTESGEHSDSSPREAESLLSEEKSQEKLSLLGRLRQAVAGLVGGGKGEAKTAVAATAVGARGTEYEYNQVRIKGFATNFIGNKKGIDDWIASQNGALEIDNKKEFGKFPMEFRGGQSIERSGDDLVMKGFSAEAYQSFKKRMFIFKIPSVSISASNPRSVDKIANLMEAKNTTTFASLLTSVGLLFQQIGSEVKSFFTGSPATIPNVAKSEPSTVSAGSESKVNVAVSTPAPTSQVLLDNKRGSLPPTPVSTEPKIERRQVHSAPAAGIPQWVSRAKVTVASNNDLDSTLSTVEKYAGTHQFRDVHTEEKTDHSLTISLEDKQGGRLSITAKQGVSEVDIEEVKRSDDTPQHMANIATELPTKGPKDVKVGGRASLKEKVVEALTTIGKHTIKSDRERLTEDKENKSQSANRPSSGPRK